jgi:hypothetical protein
MSSLRVNIIKEALSGVRDSELIKKYKKIINELNKTHCVEDTSERCELCGQRTLCDRCGPK